MNRARDPVGVDPLMHPPVALTLIPFSVKLAMNTAHQLSVGYHKRQRSTSGKQTQKEMGCFILLQAAKAAPTPDGYTAGMLMQC